jgi:hypothetical protein
MNLGEGGPYGARLGGGLLPHGVELVEVVGHGVRVLYLAGRRLPRQSAKAGLQVVHARVVIPQPAALGP